MKFFGSFYLSLVDDIFCYLLGYFTWKIIVGVSKQSCAEIMLDILLVNKSSLPFVQDALRF